MKKVIHILCIIYSCSAFAAVGIPSIGSPFQQSVCEDSDSNQLVFIGEEIDRFVYSCDEWHGGPPECNPPILLILIKYKITQILKGEHNPNTQTFEFPTEDDFVAESTTDEIWVSCSSGHSYEKGIFVIGEWPNFNFLLAQSSLKYNPDIDEYEGNISSFDSGSASLEEIISIIETCETSVGIEDNYTNLDLYPNPASTFVFLPSNVQSGEVEIYDIQGRVILKQPYETRLDVSGLLPGRYFVKTTNDAGEVSLGDLIVSN